MYPVPITEFKQEQYIYNPDWYAKDFFHLGSSGTQEFPLHHCKLTWLKSVPHIHSRRNAVDIGCRDGEFTRYLQQDFEHVFCFDPRKRKLFPRNVSQEKVTHFTCCLGNTENKYPRLDTTFGQSELKTYTLDSFNLPNIDYIKIDTDGFEYDIIQGALDTIKEYRPVIICEAAPDEALRFQQQHYAVDYLENMLGYVTVDICERNIDRIMIPKERING